MAGVADAGAGRRATTPDDPAHSRGNQFEEWIRACKGGPAAGADFAYPARLTEMVLLSNVPLCARRRLKRDRVRCEVTNVPAANAFLSKGYRPGFGV